MAITVVGVDVKRRMWIGYLMAMAGILPGNTLSIPGTPRTNNFGRDILTELSAETGKLVVGINTKRFINILETYFIVGSQKGIWMVYRGRFAMCKKKPDTGNEEIFAQWDIEYTWADKLLQPFILVVSCLADRWNDLRYRCQ